MQKFLESVAADGTRFAGIVRAESLDTPVSTCPGWTLEDLTRHMGFIHRWVTSAVETGRRPTDVDPAGPPPMTNAQLAEWLDLGVATLVSTLAGRDPEEPSWHPFDAPQVVGIWPRRQAQETMIHRWDAESAVGTPSPLDPDIAADGLLEYFEVIVPRVVGRDHRAAPRGVLRIECADVGLVCTVSSATTVDVELGDGVVATPDAVLRGSAEDVLLALWRRRTLATHESPLAQQWLGFGGN